MVIIKTDDEIKKIKKSCQLTADTLRYVSEKVKPGVTTKTLDIAAENYICQHNAKPSFKGYGPPGNGFPASICTSINDEIVHGIPSDRKLEEGEIISLDVGTNLNGYFGDSAITVPVGKISNIAEALINTTKACLFAGIKKAINGNYIGDISNAIQVMAENNHFSVVREFVGHGVGLKVHEEPQIPNYGEPGKGVKLEKGMVIAIEPMINIGDFRTIYGEDGWTVKTVDGHLSAHFEHSIAIYDDGNEILTI